MLFGKKKKQKTYDPASDGGNGRPIRAAVAIGDPQDKYSGYPSNGLSPRRLASIFREADEGDTLWSIARKYYGKRRYWKKIWNANSAITNPNRIYAGQTIILPKL